MLCDASIGKCMIGSMEKVNISKKQTVLHDLQLHVFVYDGYHIKS